MARALVTGNERSIETLDKEVDRIASLARRPTTIRCYEKAFQRLTDFCAPRDVWKAQPRDIARFCVHLFKREGLKPRAIEAYLSGINFYYEKLGKGHAVGRVGVATRKSPARGDIVSRTFKGIRRDYGLPPRRVDALMLDSIEKMVDWQPDEIRGYRNGLMILLGWAAALRQSELVSLDLAQDGDGDGWIDVVDDGLVVNLKRSKMNSEYRYLERYAVPARPTAPRYCPVRLLRRWQDAAGIDTGPVFRAFTYDRVPKLTQNRVGGVAVNKVVKRAAAGIGLNTENIGSHSLRSGCITWLVLEGVNPWRIMAHSGHRSVKSVFSYYRPVVAPSNSPLASTRWVR